MKSLCGLLALCVGLALASPVLADTITFKDGTVKKVRIYKMAKEYVSFLYEGKIEVVSRDQIDEKAKDKGIGIEGEPLTLKELAEALQKMRDDLKTKLKEEEKANGVKPAPKTEVKTVAEGKDAAKGVKVVGKDESKTKATELIIDPFPDHPILDKKGAKKDAAKKDDPKKDAAKDIPKTPPAPPEPEKKAEDK